MSSATYVPGGGNPHAKIMIIGEQPGRKEVERHTPFVGPAGQNLDECLRTVGINRMECYLTNVIKDYNNAIEGYVYFTGKRGVLTPEALPHIQELREEILQVKPNVIVACGNVPLFVLTARTGITQWRGSLLESTLVPGVKVLPTFHPATWTKEKLYSNPEAYLNKYLVVHDLKRAKKESEFSTVRLLDRASKIAPNFYEVVSYLHDLKVGTLHLTRPIVYYDIETVPGTEEISCLGIGNTADYAMCIPFTGPQGAYFTVQEEAEVMRLIGEILEDSSIPKCGQYIIFDSHLLFRKYGIVTRNIEDTFIAQRILYPEFPAGLDFIASTWTDIPYYKKDGKKWITGDGTWEQGWQYNCNDVLSCAEAFPQQLAELKAQGNLAAYERQVKLIEPLTYMMEHGIRVDVEGMKRKHQENVEAQKVLQERIYGLLGYECNLNSTQQLQEYFYGKKHIKPYRNEGRTTLNEDALKRIAAQGFAEASLILQLRELTKENSTFLNPHNVDADGRIRCAYNPAGTRFSRISSQKNIFGTGMNLQNVPHSCLTYFLPDEGYIAYSLDYSQYENRIVAYVGGIPQMIEVFEQGLDSHRTTAAFVLSIIRGRKVTYDSITAEERQDYGKLPNHAFNYGFGATNFALMHEIPLAHGKKIHSAYHLAYPRLQRGYWAYVQRCLETNRTLTNLLDRNVTFLGHWSDSLLTAAYSCIPQGTCGDAMNERGIIECYYNSSYEEAELLTQIHDAMEIQIPLNIPLRRHAEILIGLKQSLETPLEFQGKEFITPVDLVVNNCLNKEKGVELKGKKFSTNVEALEAELAQAINNLEKREECPV